MSRLLMAGARSRILAGCGMLGMILGEMGWAAVGEAVAAPSPEAVVRDLGHGINLAGALEAPREGQWGVTLEDAYFAAIQKAGFTLVRVPIRWSVHAAMTAPYAIEPAFWARIDWVAAEAKAHQLHVILDLQNYDEMHLEPARNEERFVGI
ncbi:MAG TPA: cellulase family glycosylhydrolase [Candidatus Methylacidiphilales bacterium]